MRWCLACVLTACSSKDGTEPSDPTDTDSTVTDSADSATTDSDSTAPPVGNDVPLDGFPPVVIGTVPASGALSVDPSTSRIEATFSRPMRTDSWAWVQVDTHFPEATSASFVDPDTAQLEGVVLAADQGYQAWVNDPYGTYSSFVDLAGDVAVPYPIVFATGGDPGLLTGFPTAVVGSKPVAGTADVDPSLTRLEVTFGRDMDTASTGWLPPSAPTAPVVLGEGFSDPRTAWVDVALEPGTTYALWIDGFRDASGNPSTPWLLTFRTQEP